MYSVQYLVHTGTEVLILVPVLVIRMDKQRFSYNNWRSSS